MGETNYWEDDSDDEGSDGDEDSLQPSLQRTKSGKEVTGDEWPDWMFKDPVSDAEITGSVPSDVSDDLEQPPDLFGSQEHIRILVEVKIAGSRSDIAKIVKDADIDLHFDSVSTEKPAAGDRARPAQHVVRNMVLVITGAIGDAYSIRTAVCEVLIDEGHFIIERDYQGGEDGGDML